MNNERATKIIYFRLKLFVVAEEHIIHNIVIQKIFENYVQVARKLIRKGSKHP